jgi:S-(hydroxymethyl)glutathione dehydrogenase / alcohol dehydrogenase
MKAAVLYEPGKDFEIEDLELSRPGPNEVLVRTVASGVCHSDLHVQTGHSRYPLPVVLGHESAGVVEEVGSAVRYVVPGDHVVTCTAVFCGHCRFCMSGRPYLCGGASTRRGKGEPPRLSQRGAKINQYIHVGAFAEQMLVHENVLTKIRKDADLELACLVGCAVVTGVGAVVNSARVETGSRVAIFGCGGVGLCAVQGAVLAGAGRVIAVDTMPEKLELARRLGATDLVDASQVDPVAAIRDLTSGGVDYSFEVIGQKKTVEQCFEILDLGGLATVIGLMPAGAKAEISGEQLMFRRLQGTSMGSTRPRIDIPRYVDFYMDGRLKLDDLVSQRIPLDQVNDALRALGRGSVARSVITFS